MHIIKMKIVNFKKFGDGENIFEFNDDINILVGDNEVGKSTILEAIELGCNCSYRGKSLISELSTDLFNVLAVKQYLESDKKSEYLPEILIELFLDDLPEYRGENNTLGEDGDGISLKIKFDNELLQTYDEFAKNPDGIKTIPTEFYKIEWFDFGWNQIKYVNRKVNSLYVDPVRLHPTYGTNQYISKIINTALPKEEQILLKLNYRQLKELFNEQPQVSEVNRLLDAKNVITDKSLKIVADISSSSIQSGLQLALDSINFPLIGKGEQNQIQIKLALQNKVEDIDIIMIEEPENHLSHINLSKLVNYIEENRNDKQLFIATHSSYVLNKLSLKKLCLISEKYIRLKDIDDQVSKSLKRLPGYDTLRAVLSPKTILVEGPSDELVLKKIFFDKHGLLPEEKGIDIIVVRGIGFKNYLEIAKHIGSDLRVVKDNDGNYKENIEDYKKNYKSVNFFSPTDDALYSLEPALIASNSENGEKLDLYAKVVLSTKTFNKYKEGVGLEEKVDFLRDWYRGDSGTGKKKVDSAMRIFESQEKISYPDCLIKVLDYDKEARSS